MKLEKISEAVKKAVKEHEYLALEIKEYENEDFELYQFSKTMIDLEQENSEMRIENVW